MQPGDHRPAGRCSMGATLRLALLLVLGGCASVPPPPPVVVEEFTPQELLDARRLALARVLVDACTSEPTTDERIMVVDFILRHCKLGPVGCIRRACVRIANETCATPSTSIRFK